MRNLVSIIIPAYNAERFIARTLTSALTQTWKDIEVIIVDDGSTDATRSIVQTFVATDERVRLFSTTNRGVALARNFGIECAQGAYVAFLDADDLWHPTKIERQLGAMENHDSDATWGGVYAFHRTIDENDEVTGNGPASNCRGYVLARNLVLKFIGNGSSLLVRKSAALAVGGFDPWYAAVGLGGCEDLDFELRLAARYRIEAVRSFLVGYRIYNGNMSSDGLRMARSMVETLERQIKRASFISPRIQRWAVGGGYRYAFQVLLRDRRFIPAMRAYQTMALMDPILSIIVVAELAVAVCRKLSGALTKVSYHSFLAMNPEADVDEPLVGITRMRLKRLVAEDRALESRNCLLPPT